MTTNLPNNLLHIRRKLGLSQAKFMHWLGISFEAIKRSNYYHYEVGRHQPPLGDILRLAKRLGLSMEQLLFADLSKTLLPPNHRLLAPACKHVLKPVDGSLAEYYEHCIFCKQVFPIGHNHPGQNCSFKPAGPFWQQCHWCGKMERRGLTEIPAQNGND